MSTKPAHKCCRYRHTAYHKQTKNQWARDDPAYVIICCLLVAAAASAYCVACVTLASIPVSACTFQ